jgi:hypothetical protein
MQALQMRLLCYGQPPLTKLNNAVLLLLDAAACCGGNLPPNAGVVRSPAHVDGQVEPVEEALLLTLVLQAGKVTARM